MNEGMDGSAAAVTVSAIGLLDLRPECLKTAKKHLICDVKFSGKRHCHVR